MSSLSDRKEELIVELEEKFFDEDALEDDIVRRLHQMTESELMLLHRIVAKVVSVAKRKD
jgi:hypothetical protein